MRAFVAIVFVALLGLSGARAAELTSQELAAKAEDSLVFIATRYFDENTNQTKVAGSGSGFVITEAGLVLTAYHVVKDWNNQSDDDKANNSLRIRLGSSHGDEVDAGIVGINEQYDVALLQILRPGTYKATGVCFANTLAAGEAVTGFGFPDGLERTSSPGTFGNASADNGRWAVSFNNAEGMSGGPLYDQFGDVVGIIRGTYGGQGASNVVTPVRRAKGLIDEQTSFTEECLRNGPAPAPTPTPVSDDDWYGGTLWRDGEDYCKSVQAMIAATTKLSVLHYADTGKAVTGPKAGDLRENLLLTQASDNQPLCSIDQVPGGTSGDPGAVDCGLDITKSLPAFQQVFTAASEDLDKCLRTLKWQQSDRSPDCTLDSGEVSCYSLWLKNGHEGRLYSFASGDPVVYGLGVYFSIPGK